MLVHAWIPDVNYPQLEAVHPLNQCAAIIRHAIVLTQLPQLADYSRQYPQRLSALYPTTVRQIQTPYARYASSPMWQSSHRSYRYGRSDGKWEITNRQTVPKMVERPGRLKRALALQSTISRHGADLS